MQVRMLGSDRSIIQSCRNRVRQRHLSVAVLQQVAEATMQNSGRPSAKTRRMFTERETASARFDPHQPNARVGDERVEDANRVRASADAGKHLVRQPSLCFQTLL